MFPWSPEFAWDATHVAFFGALYSVLATVAGTLAVAAWRARRDAREGRAAAIAWHGDFHEMPDSARACRHQITGKAPGRACENGFDCRPCDAHGHFEELGRPDAPLDAADHFGFDLPLDRLYHRGHTWVRPEPDGTLTVGLDDLARRLVGAPERVELPAAGSRLQVNGPAGNSGIAPGDSGGPLFWRDPQTGAESIVGICSGGEGNWNSVSYHYRADTQVVRDFIQEVIDGL